MTTPWKPNAEWQGATVAVFGSGPSLTPEAVEALRANFCIAVNHSCLMAPWADMLVALDGNWPQERREFEGMRVTGVADPDLDAFYIGSMYERVRVAPGHEIEIRNSGLAAIRIAAGMGASRIILAGFDPERRGHLFGGEAWQAESGEPYPGLTAGLAQITAELAARGVVVERYEPPRVEGPAERFLAAIPKFVAEVNARHGDV